MRYAIIRDKRLGGTFDAGLRNNDQTNIFTAYANTPIRNIHDAIASEIDDALPNRTLFILCHGFAGSSQTRQQSADVGGGGLQLGAENVLHSNVASWSRIAGYFRNIIVYACAASNTEEGTMGTDRDGRYLMGALAIHTRADVYAADRIQYYQRRGFNFGGWEGQLLHFGPNGRDPQPVNRPPLEFSEIPRRPQNQAAARRMTTGGGRIHPRR